jgi:alkylation response protein AidB-like acyl-CoA dehydrogenase
MPGLSDAEMREFTESVRGSLRRVWPTARMAGEQGAFPVLEEIWRLAAAQGWTALAADRSLDAVMAAAAELGQLACPFPLLDIYVAAELFKSLPAVADAITAGEIRPVIASGAPSGFRFVEAAPAATHVLALSDTGTARLWPISGTTPTGGLAMPAWSDVSVACTAVAEADAGAEAIEEARTLYRLGLAARAIGAAARAVELSIDHARNRVAFGKPIGAYQAVSHRAVDGATDITATRLLIDEAVTAYARGAGTWTLAAELAVEFGAKAAADAQFGAHHTLAATGYFEEHDAPWLFRRANADVTQLGNVTPAAGSVIDRLIEEDLSLPALELGGDAEEFRAEVREFIRPFRTDDPFLHLNAEANEQFNAAAIAQGYLTMSWPAEFGGQAASVQKQAVLTEELAYNKLALSGKAVADMGGIAIIRHGTAEQQQRFLPLMAQGALKFYLGYSEPEVGSDLASLRTKAVRDGDEWVVNGRKMWGTGAHTADWVWLAARTDPDAPRPQAGITLFLTRLNRPGWEASQHTALSGEVSCSTFFDDFRVPDTDRVGEVNGGWKVITEALTQERVNMAGSSAVMLRQLDDLLALVRKDAAGTVGARGSAERARLSRIAARLQASRVLANASLRAYESGAGSRLEAPMGKIVAGHLMEDFSRAAVQILGPAGALGEQVPGVPGGGVFEYGLRLSIMYVVAGGTVDIQRNLVARALGLPAR